MSLIYARFATNTDLPDIIYTINKAKSLLKRSGSGQWQGNYPTEETIETDIENKYGLALIVNNQIAGYAVSVVGEGPTYQRIDGAWKNKIDSYATFHRLTISSEYRGMHLTSFTFSDLVSIMVNQEIRNFRIDASRKNEIMQHLAVKHNFIECGVAQVGEGPRDPSRLAYELNI